jgi:hypothetical protein
MSELDKLIKPMIALGILPCQYCKYEQQFHGDHDLDSPCTDCTVATLKFYPKPAVKPVASETGAGIDSLLTGREKTYGAYKNHALIAQRLKNIMRAEPKYGAMTFYQKESLEMIQHKIARILNGDPNYADNWVDIAGYAQLVVNELQKLNKPIQQEPYICDRNRPIEY